MVQSKGTPRVFKVALNKYFCGRIVLGTLLKYERKIGSGAKTPLMRTLLYVHMYWNKK